MMRALRGPNLRCVASRREGEDLLAECVSVGICLHLSCGQQNVILWRMRGRRGSVLADLLRGHDGAVIVRGFVASLVYCWSASAISEGGC